MPPKPEGKYVADDDDKGGSSGAKPSAMASSCLPFARLMRRKSSSGPTSIEHTEVEEFRPDEAKPSRAARAAPSGASGDGAYNAWLSMLSGHQLHEIKEAFRKFDKDDSGYIDANELAAVIRLMGGRVTNEQARGLISSVDVDGSGTIEFSEFLVIMARRMLTTEGTMELDEALRLFTVDADNRIQCSEIRSLLGEHGEAPLEAEELEELLLLADPGGTGYCDVATFRALPCWQLPAVDAQGNPRSQVRPRALPGTRPAGPPSI
eukprot:Transcript_12178.p1 GENE.Transcript_12178~~Transcript_12178.p1  ORF type:complete len:300 (-),score=57.51 Transcript_12178:415-1206(-)